MFDPRDSRMPSAPDNALGDFIIDILQKEKDPTGCLGYVDNIVRVGNYTNREFDDLVEAVFDAADALMSGRVRTIGEAAFSATILYCSDLAIAEKARFIDDLPDRDFDDLRAMSENYLRLKDAIARERERPRGRGRDDRDDRSRGRGRDDRDDRRDDRGRDRGYSRRDSQRRQSPDDIRAERQREAEEQQRQEKRSRAPVREERAPAKERVRNARGTQPAPLDLVKNMSMAKRKNELAAIEFDIFKYLSGKGDDVDRRLRREEFEQLGIDADYYTALGGIISDVAQTYAEASQPRQEPARSAEPQTQSSTRELDRSSRRADMQRQTREAPQSVVEPVAFEEVFAEADVAPRRSSTTASDPVAVQQASVRQPPTISEHIDYNSNITSLGIQYGKDEVRPTWDPLVPTLQQWADAGYDITDENFIYNLPELPEIRGYMAHRPAMYNPELWVPYLTATPDGYKMTAFRERDMNKDDILIPHFGELKRTEPVKAPFYEAVGKTTRFDPLAVSAEANAAVLQFNDDKAAWVDAGKPADQEPIQATVYTERNGQLAIIKHTVHAYHFDDAMVRIQAHMADLEVGLDNTSNISANVVMHKLVGVCDSDTQWTEAKTALAMLEFGGEGTFLTMTHLWREFTEAKNAVPTVIWHKIDRELTRVTNDILQDQMGLTMTIDSFAESAGRLIDIVAEHAGRYMAEVFAAHAEYISKRLRCLSFNADDNLGDVARGIWVLDARRVVYADATMAELGLASTDSVSNNEVELTDKLAIGSTRRYAIRPEQHRLLVTATDRLMGEARNTVSASSANLTDMVVDIVTLDSYRCTLSQNWLSKGLYLAMSVTRF